MLNKILFEDLLREILPSIEVVRNVKIDCEASTPRCNDVAQTEEEH